MLRYRETPRSSKMFPRTEKPDPSLTIEVDEPSHALSPGTVITGRVRMDQGANYPKAIVQVALYGRGRAETLDTVIEDPIEMCVDRWNHHVNQWYIHGGPLRITQDTPELSWPFSLSIPSNPSPWEFLNIHNTGKEPLVYDPPRWRGTLGVEYSIEYRIEATLVKPRRRASSCIVNLPFILRAPPSQDLTPPDLQVYIQNRSVSTYRLQQATEGARLSFTQKMRELLHFSKVPRLNFALYFRIPSVIRLDDPSPTSLFLSIRPYGWRSIHSLQNAPHTAEITSLDLTLRARTFVLANRDNDDSSYTVQNTVNYNIYLPTSIPATTRPVSAKPRSAHLDFSAGPSAHEKGGLPPVHATHGSTPEGINLANTSEPTSSRKPLLVPILWKADTHGQSLDIGAMLNLHFNRTSIKALGKNVMHSREERIFPSLANQCMTHSYTFRWKLRLKIAGKSAKFRGTSPVSVVGKSYSPLAVICKRWVNVIGRDRY